MAFKNLGQAKNFRVPAAMATVEVRLRTDRGAAKVYFEEEGVQFGDVMHKFCRELNLDKEKTTFFIHDDLLVPEEPIEYVDFKKGDEVFVGTEGRLLRYNVGYFALFRGQNIEDIYAVRHYEEVPEKEKLYKIAKELRPGWKYFYLTRYGFRPLEENDTGPIAEEELVLDETGYPHCNIVVRLDRV